MRRRFAALALLASLLAATQSAAAMGTMCAEPSFAAAQERQEPPGFVPSPLRDEELPWCARPEDPRCAPLHSDSGAFRINAREPTAIAGDPAVIAGARCGAESFAPNMGLNPHAGVHSRVERPPRADR
jgi:hypothetical protein